jgi:hypothetical protein
LPPEDSTMQTPTKKVSTGVGVSTWLSRPVVSWTRRDATRDGSEQGVDMNSKAAWVIVVGGLCVGCGLDATGLLPLPAAGGAAPTTTATGSGGHGLGPVGGGGAGAHGATGGGGSGAGPTGGGGSAPVENCLNGIDDDGNGLTDCDDSACSTYACVPSASGMDAYAVLVGAPGDCTAPTSAASWNTCSCGCTPNAGACNVTVEAYRDASCDIHIGTVSTGGCGDIMPDGVVWLSGSTAPSSQASCSPAADHVPAPVNACTLTDVGRCTGNAICVPPVFAGAKQCVVMPVGSPCPAPYTVGQTAFLGGTTCTCDCANSGSTCDPPAVDVYFGSNGCGNAPQAVPLPGPCTALPSAGSLSVPSVAATTACFMSDAVTGGTPDKTLCCLP